MIVKDKWYRILTREDACAFFDEAHKRFNISSMNTLTNYKRLINAKMLKFNGDKILYRINYNEYYDKDKIYEVYNRRGADGLGSKNLIDFVKESNKMNTCVSSNVSTEVRIIDRYYNEEAKKLEEKRRAAVDKIMRGSDEGKACEAMVSIINKNSILPRYTFEQIFNEDMLNDKYRLRIEETQRLYREEKEKLVERCRECTDLLDMCDTYEEKEHILRTYKMIKEKAMYN